MSVLESTILPIPSEVRDFAVRRYTLGWWTGKGTWSSEVKFAGKYTRPEAEAELKRLCADTPNLQANVVEVSSHVTPSLRVIVTRQMFVDSYTIHLPNGHTEELDTDEIEEWFRARGANMEVVDRGLTQTWNFLRCAITICNPKEPALRDARIEPLV